MPSVSRRHLLLLPLAVLAFAQQPPHKIDDLDLRNATRNADEWLSYGIDQGETRYSPLKQIDTTNVSRLALAWSHDLGPGGGNQEETQLVWNGNIYVITNWSVVI